MKLNYEGFQDEIYYEFDKLFKDLIETYEKVTGSKFDINNNKFTNEIFDKDFDLLLSDKEGMLSTALVLIESSRKESSAVALFQSYRFAMHLAISAERQVSQEYFDKKIKSEAANIRWQLDPRNNEKYFVKECWLDWKKTPNRYKSKIDFAKDMLEKCEYLTSTKVIEDWCRKWDKEKM